MFFSSPKEIPENAADIAHLAHLHTPGFVSGVDLRYTNSKTWTFLRHDWKVRVFVQYRTLKGDDAFTSLEVSGMPYICNIWYFRHIKYNLYFFLTDIS